MLRVLRRNLLAMTISANLCCIIASLYLLCPVSLIVGQVAQGSERHVVDVRVSDENRLPVPGASVTLIQGNNSIQRQTDYSGDCEFDSVSPAPYKISTEKPGYYRNIADTVDPQARHVELTLTHVRREQQNVNVTETLPVIDPEQTSNRSTMNTQEIDNIPYPTSRDIRNLLPFNPGVVQDSGGQAHVTGSNTYETKDLLDGFNITSPVSGNLDMRFSTDAVRATVVESTRYPVEYGQASGGIIAFRSGMGDDHYRFNVTNFFPSFQDRNGLEVDQFVPRVTFSGPIRKGRAWFYNAAESEFDNIVISELPSNADNDLRWRGSNLTKTQFNFASANVMTLGLLWNDYHSPYDGISPSTPKQTTTDRNIIAGLAYVKDQHSFSDGTVLDLGLAAVRFRDSYEPQGTLPFVITPETTNGSFFENLVSHSERVQETADAYLPPKQFAGRHSTKVGVEVDQVHYNENATRQPVDYLGENGNLVRESTFAPQPYFSHGDLELGTYVEDRWSVHDRLMVEPGIRFDWDEIVHKPLFSPRIALASSFSKQANTKISAGIGLYYDRTQLQYIESAFQSPRTDTFYAANGTTPTRSALSNFVLSASLEEPRVINWSIALEQKLPGSNYISCNFVEKRSSNGFVFLNNSPTEYLGGTYTLTNTRRNKYDGVDISLRHIFSRDYTLFGSYTRSYARSNEVLDYFPTLSILGRQGSGPLPWDTPNRVLSWGWLPVPLTKRFDFVYTLQWRTGFSFSAVNAPQQLVGTPDSYRFPDYFSFSPGMEVRFHWRKYYLGLRGVLENVTGHSNPFSVNSVTDSRQFLTFSNFEGRSATARIRIISTN